MSRKPDYPIHPLILNRWSPRSMSGEPISDAELFSLFEAARWAPSSYNNQPWRYVYAKRETPFFKSFLSLLSEGNQRWASQAAALVVSLAKKTFDNGKPSMTHSFDAGAAWENLCLEGSSRKLAVHGMQGFDYAKAAELLKVPEEYEIMAMFAVGKRAPAANLPTDLQEREKPSSRKPIEEFSMEGTFRDNL